MSNLCHISTPMILTRVHAGRKEYRPTFTIFEDRDERAQGQHYRWKLWLTEEQIKEGRTPDKLQLDVEEISLNALIRKIHNEKEKE